MTPTIIQEFTQALQEEITAIKKGKGGSTVKVFNGKFLREFSGLFVYVFNLENFLVVIEDSPAEIEIRGNKYSAQVLMTQALEVEIGIEHFCGQFIPEAKLQTNLWYLIELLKKKYVECQNGSLKPDFHLSELLFSGHRSDSDVALRSGANYSTSYNPPNPAQKRAIESSSSARLCVIWGPPGTGKTKTIAQAIEAHLNVGRRVLLVSHANNAVDEALEDVAEHLKDTPFYQDGKLIRLGKPQEEHYKKLERDYELVLPDRVAAKLCESLIQEKGDLDIEKQQIEDSLAQLDTAFQALQSVKLLSSELADLKSAESEAKRKLVHTQNELRQLEQVQSSNSEKLIEAQTAGTIKRIFKRLDPQRIQEEIDRTRIAIDSKRRIVAEVNVRISQLMNSINAKEEEVSRAKAEAASFLKRLKLPLDQLERKKKELDTRKDVILARIAEINRQLDDIQKKILSEASLIATTLTKTFVAKQFPDNPFDVLVLDESSMAPLPHLYWAASRCRQMVTIVGDFLQLPPICIAEEPMAQKWLGRSIFTVLGISSVEEACNDNRVSLLDTQYRMSPAISAIPNRFFYQGKLKDHPSTFKQELIDGVSKSPLVMIDTSAMNPWCSRLKTGGRFNLYSALLSATLARRIIQTTPKGKIGIVTPYTAQARLINKIANDWGILDRVRVSTVHRFQGGEEPIIIFDSVEGAGTKVAPMLDDTQRDSDARLLLNVAITRAKSRLYFIGHRNHLLSDLHPDSALARLINYLYENAEIMHSENFVDNYFTSDFEAWADALLSMTAPTRTPISGDSYTSKSFWPQFINDLKTTKERLIIHSPFLTVKRAGRFIDYFRSMVDRGIEIRIHTWPSNRQQGNMVEQSETVINNLRAISVKVIEGYHTSKKHFKTAIIDNHILWDGSLNILSHKDTEEHMWRYEGTSAVEQIIRNLELDEDIGIGNQIDEVCPVSGDVLVIRQNRKSGQKFIGCSKYPKCKYTKPLEGDWKWQSRKR